ncbi:gram-negative porin family protein [Burkholderia gladioli]|uniref:Porin n=1 Tax=Burkholderia gladioli TaxID=28095 RepID=A0A095F2H6_BURGA|nr:porin [Burkholderia gladioli]AJW98511.1 gram-negative porin family protein [Burkholderia gladioli]ASD79897.1 porin [Burkholderia gladioli pv. gladioli]AWY54860.1 porin [Burkholderia gladioli pv. gladioli]KGC11150.1 gram-negative porin family protein [Burkholderia gladioli]PEH37873.1 porin [Burkholderia gladioli]
MKKQLTILALALAAAPTAFAQSTVTLYGVIDEGVNYTNNTGGHSNVEMQSGYAYGSRWGMRGAEDLGGGMKAIFTLENGFDLNTGRANQGGRMFGRQALVGVSSNYGTFTMGRQYDSVVDYVGPTTANGSWAGYLFAHPYDNDNTDNSFRVSNSVKYASPNLGGFTFGGVYGFSNAAGQFANNRLMSVGASYSGGPVTVAVAYMDIDNVGGNSTGAVATNDSSFFAGHQREVTAGINYNISGATVGFAYSHVRLENPTGNGYLTPGTFPTGVSVSSLTFDNFEFNALYHFTTAFYVGGMYTYTRGHYDGSNGSSHPNWNQFGLMADYNISKRTDVYVQGVYQKVSGSTGTFLDQAYITGADNSSSSNKQFVARVALRHLF